ncbi:hypothetical protein HYV91_03100 [Candidatus Wolfebacteria bacterium]|nr:hypothetical protein [Candidatus Wolfebacteria bacterium]
MKVIPAINCADWRCIKNKIFAAAKFADWVQIDVADGKFTDYKTWNRPSDLQLTTNDLRLNIEIHLMVQNPERVIKDWIKAGAKRIVVHLEAIDTRKFSRIWPQISQMAEIGLAINPETVVDKLSAYLQPTTNDQQPITKFIQLLAVHPGKSGQKFDKRIPAKIKFLKKYFPNVKIEVDGGINLETAKVCKKAGADIIVAGSYIFDDSNPAKAYKQLTRV